MKRILNNFYESFEVNKSLSKTSWNSDDMRGQQNSSGNQKVERLDSDTSAPDDFLMTWRVSLTPHVIRIPWGLGQAFI